MLLLLQARPDDYAPEYLETQIAVSFHKHWMIDPIKVYKKWFEEADDNTSTRQNSIRNELQTNFTEFIFTYV